MFYLHVSNKTEHLLQHLATLIKVDPQRNIFEKEYILIQSQGMERMISQYMADSFKSWCNFEYLLPINFLQGIAKRLGMEIIPDSFDRNFLCWRIEDKLRRIDEDIYEPLRQYLKGTNAGLKRFQLARQLANIFDQYQLMRPQMLQDWENGHMCSGDSSEVWQMNLWNRLLVGEGVGQHRGKLLQKVIARLQNEDAAGLLPHRVSVFGLHIMAPLFLDYLSGMSKHCDVHLFLLSPCQHYWGDVTGRREVFRERVARLEKGLFVDELPEQHHPLLSTLGKQGRVFQEMLLEAVTFEKEIPSYEDPFSHENPTLLHLLQSDLLAGFLPECSYDFADDDSVRIISCHSRPRELAVLKDHVLDLLYRDKELQLRDIIIMAPDIQDYAAFIPAVFEDIQYSIADRSLNRRNIFIAVFEEFLSLTSGRFGWVEVFEMLQKEQVYPNFALSSADFDRLQHWIISGGIRWGLSSKTRKKSTGLEFSENSWRAGLNRLLMGYMIDADCPVEGVLPYVDIEGGEAKILGGVCEFIDLMEKVTNDFSHSYGLKEWSTLLLDYTNRLFGQTDERDLMELRSVLLKLVDYDPLHNQKVDIEIVRDWFADSSTEARSASGFLRGQLTFCSMLPMRSIPFKTVCIIGMNHGAFPKIDRHITFDLIPKQPRPGDRSIRADDRYQFLEALLAARENLYISFVGQSLQNNDSIPPSVVVTELLETLQDGYNMKNIIVKHPLHPFSPKYFSNISPHFFSYSEDNFQIAANMHGLDHKRPVWWSGKVETEIEVIDIADLLSFYRNPQLYFVQKCMGVGLSEEIALPEARESFTVEGLDSFIINQEILEKWLNGEDLDSFHLQLSEEGRWPLGVPGGLAFSQRSEELKRFSTILKAQEMGARIADVELDIHIGRYRLVGKLSNLYEDGLLIVKFSDLKGKDLLGGWIHHLVGAVLEDIGTITRVVTKNSQVCFDSYESLMPGLDELVEHYVEGCSMPSGLYIEPAFQYCLQKIRRKARLSPMLKAEKTLRISIDKGYEPAWSLLNREEETVILGQTFEDLCNQIMMPVMRYLQ